MVQRPTSDPLIGQLLSLNAQLVTAAHEWSLGTDVNSRADELLREALCASHLRYVDRIPRYRQLAERESLTGSLDVDTIINQMMIGTELFKSYQQVWLEGSDFAAMTLWLESIFAHPLELEVRDVRGVQDWQQRLETMGVRLTYSSGTSGRMSFVPRDPLTWRAYCRNSQTYANHAWFEAQALRGSFDCFIAGPRGTGMGIMAAAAGLAQLAARQHYLLDAELTADQVQQFHAGSGAEAFAADRTGECYDRAVVFFRRSIEEQRPLLIFGAPFQIRRLCEQVSARCGRLPAPPESMVVTGGGWKSFQGERIPRSELDRTIEAVWGIGLTHIVDAYGTAELNCTLNRCAYSRYHIPPLIQPVVLDEALLGSWDQQGWGLLGFLDPFAMSYPGFIITGDFGELRRGCCECGLKGWYIEGEIQRAANQEIRGCGGVMASILA